jgi:hypothetical protein
MTALRNINRKYYCGGAELQHTQNHAVWVDEVLAKICFEIMPT